MSSASHMAYSEADLDKARNAMVDDLLHRQIISIPALARAVRRVPRHAIASPPYIIASDLLGTECVYTDDPRSVYTDAAVALTRDRDLWCPPPSTTARQLEQLAALEGMRILHVETGSGYGTALLADLVAERGSVVGVNHGAAATELSSAFLVQAECTNVTVHSGDGAAGAPDAGPFDRILVSAGAADIAPAWIEQLGEDGRLVLPLCYLGPLGSRISFGALLTVDKSSRGLTGSIASALIVAPLPGALAPEEDVRLADGLQRWFALEDFYRTEFPLRLLMKSDTASAPDPSAVPWMLETRTTTMWVEPN
jgi:protein-L-isoaspartate(D-aspartate) O-methyltransferase